MSLSTEFGPARSGIAPATGRFASRARRWDGSPAISPSGCGNFPSCSGSRTAAVDLDPGLAGFEQRSEAVAEALLALKAEGLVPGWRNEPYPVGSDFYAPPLMQMERAAVPLFGVRAYGVHVNGFVGSGRRSAALGRQARGQQADGAGQARSSRRGRPAHGPQPDGECDQGIRRGGGHGFGPGAPRAARRASSAISPSAARACATTSASPMTSLCRQILRAA